MALTNEQYERLLWFIDADMTMEEMEAFEKELNTNPEMRKQLDFELSVRDTFQFKDGKEHRELNNSITVPGVKKNVGYIWKLAAAAAACVLVILSTILLVNRKKSDPSFVKRIDTLHQTKNDTANITQVPNTNKLLQVAVNTDSLFKKYYIKEPVPDEYPMLLADAFDNYKKGNFNTFEHLDLSGIQTRGGADENETILTMGNFYKGIAALEKNKTVKAVSYFNQVLLNAKGEIWREKAHWYLAMSYLKATNGVAAFTELNQVTGADLYSKKAKQILKLLKP